MTSYDTLNEIDDPSFDLPDSSEYQLQVKYSYQKGKLQKPRRNRSAFIIFSSETRAKLKLDEGNLNSNEMMVRLADLWKNLSNEERDRYENLAKEDRLRYQQELIEFTKFNPNETIHNKTKNNHVKKPCSAYGIFLKERKDVIKTQHPDYKMADVLKIVSQEWKNLPEDHKQMYQNKATMEKEVIQTKISEALARDQVAQESLQPKTKKQVKRNDSNEAFETNTQTDMSMTPMLKHNNSSLSSQQSWPRVGESLYIPIQPHVGLPEDYLKMEHSPSVDTMRSLSHQSSSNFETMMNQYVNHQVSNDSRYYNPAPVMNQMNQMNQAHMANAAMMANYMNMGNMGNMGMNFDRMSSTQTNPESYVTHAQYQPQPVQKSISQQSSGSQQHKNQPAVNQHMNQPVHQHVNHPVVKPMIQQPNQQINAAQKQISQSQPQPQPQQQVFSQPKQVTPQQVLNVDMNLFNKYMDNFASSDLLFDDPLFEKGDF